MKPYKCKIIGITGGIASGKSTVSNYLIDNGYKVVDADKISREIMEKGRKSYKLVKSYFGEEVLLEDGNIDRKKLGSIVFSSKEKLKKLNQFTHPYIFKEMKAEVDRLCESNKLVFVDIPLLYEERENIEEEGLFFDQVWLVYVDEKTQLKRLMERNHLSESEAANRIKAQMPLDEKKKKSLFILDNSKSIYDLKKDVDRLVEQISEV